MTVQIENRDNGIQIVRLTGASASKSFSRESLPIIADAIDKGLKNPEIKGMVITGDGKFFSAGADLNNFSDGDKGRAISMAIAFGEAFEALSAYRGVSIAV
ncbi:MAG: enoyl-CoA hydratase-related protein, partial [Candidatus Poseidoniaceae archaeon]